MVVGTYAATPYVHLQLEARRRLFPDVPLLVHDDNSHQADELNRLCQQYGCDFEVNSRRLPHQLGDISVFVGGLRWAASKRIELLLKVSRRWIFLVDWTNDLKELAMASQNATFSNFTRSYEFGFRTECIGMAVTRWATPEFFRPAIERIVAGEHVFVEAYMHQFAMRFSQQNCGDADCWTAAHPVPEDRRGYAPWDLMGTDRINRSPSGKYLWHDSHSHHAYARQAANWGLPYAEADFVDPNQGGGNGPPNVDPLSTKPSAWVGLEGKYQRLIEGVTPIKLIVEIGVDYGWSLFHLAKDHPTATVLGVDHFAKGPVKEHLDNEPFVRSLLPKFPNVRLLTMPAAEAVEHVREPIDVLHVDAEPEYEAVKAHFDIWSPKVRAGGCILFHDVDTHEGVRRVFEELPGTKRCIHEHHGLGCWYKP
jgi:hypothetical protein